MATSGTRVFIQTRDDIVKAAFRKIGWSGNGGIVDTTTTKFATSCHALNSMVASWQSDGVYLWAALQTTLSLVAATGVYIITEPYLELMNFYVARTEQDYPCRIQPYENYATLPIKSLAGIPDTVYVEYGLANITIHTYPISPTADTLHYTAIQKLQDFNNETDNPDFPVRWSNALIYGLAWELSPEAGLALADRQDLEKRFGAFYELAKTSSREKSGMQISPRRR